MSTSLQVSWSCSSSFNLSTTSRMLFLLCIDGASSLIVCCSFYMSSPPPLAFNNSSALFTRCCTSNSACSGLTEWVSRMSCSVMSCKLGLERDCFHFTERLNISVTNGNTKMMQDKSPRMVDCSEIYFIP